MPSSDPSNEMQKRRKIRGWFSKLTTKRADNESDESAAIHGRVRQKGGQARPVKEKIQTPTIIITEPPETPPIAQDQWIVASDTPDTPDSQFQSTFSAAGQTPFPSIRNASVIAASNCNVDSEPPRPETPELDMDETISISSAEILLDDDNMGSDKPIAVSRGDENLVGIEAISESIPEHPLLSQQDTKDLISLDIKQRDPQAAQVNPTPPASTEVSNAPIHKAAPVA